MEVLLQKQLEVAGYHQEWATRHIPCGASNKQIKQPLLPETLFQTDHSLDRIYLLAFMFWSHSQDFLHMIFVSFPSCWYIPVSLSKQCPHGLLPGLLGKAMAKFSSWSVSSKKSIRTHQMMVPPVPDAPSVAGEKATKAIYPGHHNVPACVLPCTEEVSILGIWDCGKFGICFSLGLHVVWE